MTVRQQSLPGDLWLVSVSGRLDQNMTPALEQTLGELLDDGHNRLIVDLGEADYINSGGLRCLVAAWRKARQQGGDLFLCGLRARVAEVVSMVGFDKVFSVFSTADEAATAWREAA